MPGTVKSPVSYFLALSTGESAWGKAEGDVDVSAARVLAYLWHYESYERTKPKVTNDLLHMAVGVPDSHSMFQLVEFKIPLATNRVWACMWTWRQEANDDFLVALTSIQDLPWSKEKTHVRNLINKRKSAEKVVHGELRGFYRIHPLAENVCRVTFVAQGALGGQIPDRVMKSLIKYSLGIVEEVQDKCVREGAKRAQKRVGRLKWRSLPATFRCACFARRYERSGKAVDAELRSKFPAPPSEFQEDQVQVVQRCLKVEADTNADVGLPWAKLESPALVDLWMRQALAGTGERCVTTGKAVCVLDTSARNAAARYFFAGGRESMRIHLAKGDLARVILSRLSEHDFTFAAVKKMPFPLYNREFVNRQLCFKDEVGRLVVVFEPPQEEVVVDYGRRMNAVRGRATGFLRFTPIASNTQCKLELYQQVDAEGRIPVFVVNGKVGQALSPVADMREQFQRDDEVDALERGRLADIIR
jgi:hypothetical protein